MKESVEFGFVKETIFWGMPQIREMWIIFAWSIRPKV